MENRNLNRLNEILKIIKKSNLASGITPEKVVSTVEALGPTFIKLGQIVSTRVDIIPPEYCEELSKLRNHVTPLSFVEIDDILKNSYENYTEIFSEIDNEPIGSASIAQVHRAKLKHNGKRVVLKIKRPGIDDMMKTDILLLKKAVNILKLNRIIKVMDLSQVLDQIYKTTLEELDFMIETEHLIKFGENNKDEQYISCPYVYRNLCTSNVIVMDYINGIKINNLKNLQESGYDLEVIANILSTNYIKQALHDGFFHADPHPDNILVKNNSIVFLDLGMMGNLSLRNKKLLKQCITAINMKDYKEVSRILVSMSEQTQDIDYIKLERDIANILENYASAHLETINISNFITDMFKMLQQNHLVLDKDITMLIRGIGVIESVLKELNPQLNLLEVLMMSEYVKISNNLFNVDNLKDASYNMAKNINSMIGLPSEFSDFLKSLNNGETKFKVELSDSSNQVDKLENLVHELIIGFIDGCLIITTVLVDNTVIRIILLFLIILFSLWLVIKMIIDHIHKGY